MENATQFSLRQRLAAGLATGTIGIMSFSSLAIAQTSMTHYLDVEAGAWYEEAADALLKSGALDESELRLRPNALATRAEVMKLLVNVSGRSMIMPPIASFNDVAKTAWYYTYVETSADAGWVRGDRDCYRNTRPCTARPGDGVNRAEMAALLQRAFSLSYKNTAPVFSDNAVSAWYFTPVQTAADHCILQGDSGTGNVRPSAFMNRAEMVVMFHRASEDQEYGSDCGVTGEADAEIRSAVASTLRRVRLSFSADLNRSIADDAVRYDVVRATGGGSIDVSEAIMINDHTVDLLLRNDVIEGVTYHVKATNLQSAAGKTFNDSATFNFTTAIINPGIKELTVRTASSIRVEFASDVDASRADDAVRYEVERLGSSGGMIGVKSARLIDDHTVDLQLVTSLQSQVNYRLTITDMRTESGENFTDNASFIMAAGVPDLLSINVLSSARIELNFNVDLDESIAEDRYAYRVRGPDGDSIVGRATLTDDRRIELSLDTVLQNQQEYTVTATDLRTTDDVDFTDTRTFVYGAATTRFTTNILGIREVPAVVSPASGTGTFTLSSTGLQFDITVRNLSGSVITGAHFHQGDVGVEGGVLEPITFNSNLRAIGTWEGLTAEERNLLIDGSVYVNVHTVAHPDGEIRGQVVPQ
jgi:hypothetical protein